MKKISLTISKKDVKAFKNNVKESLCIPRQCGIDPERHYEDFEFAKSILNYVKSQRKYVYVLLIPDKVSKPECFKCIIRNFLEHDEPLIRGLVLEK